jgi:hypothetical protein
MFAPQDEQPLLAAAKSLELGACLRVEAVAHPPAGSPLLVIHVPDGLELREE